MNSAPQPGTGHSLKRLRNSAKIALAVSAAAVLFAVRPGTEAAAADTLDPGFEVLVRLFYDREVISFCGGATDTTLPEFSNQRANIISRFRIGRIQVDAATFEAARRADREWKNRGLGGFRHWCRQEGNAALRRFGARSPSGRY